MKKLTVILKIITVGLVIAFLPSGCNSGGVPDSLPSDEDIASISLMYYKAHYHEGETFNTDGNKLRLYYTDRTNSDIYSGFTLEWSLEPGKEVDMTWDEWNSKILEWIDDNSAWKPIRHGDILPVSPPANFPIIPSTTFYVRADYKGIKSGARYRAVYRQGYPMLP